MDFHEPDPRDPSTSEDDQTFVTEDEIAALTEERQVFGGDEYQQAERILKENLPAVTQSVIKLARGAQSETVRLNAAKYVIDRNLGRITEPEVGENDPLHDFMTGVTETK